MVGKFLSIFVKEPMCLHISCLLHKISGETVKIVSRAPALTSNIFEVDGLSVWVEQLDDRVVVVLHSAADGGHFPLDHRHIVSCQVLTFDFTKTTKKTTTDGKNFISEGRQAFLSGYLQPQIFRFLTPGAACEHMHSVKIHE